MMTKVKIFLIFVYGNDFIALKRYFKYSKILEHTWTIILVIIIGMILLYFIRRIAKLRRNDISTVYVDMMILVTGAASLRYHHKWEKIFFGIFIFGIFFINTIGIDNTLFHLFLLEEDYRVDTFEKLAQTKAPVTVNPFRLRYENGTIFGKLRLV